MNVLTDPTNLMPGAMMAGEIKNVYHGSPHLFDKFSTEKIGTGEGAQAYGYGLYFSDKREVAEYYKKNLSNERGFSFGAYDNMARQEVIDLVNRRFGNNYLDGVIRPGGVADRVMDDLVAGKKDNLYPKNSDRYEAYEDIWERLSWNGNQGHIYEATIAKGRPHTMLQWDKPVTKAQWNKIRSQAIKEGIDDIDAIMGKVFDEPGSYVYYNLSDAITRKLNAKAGGDVFRDDPKLASEFLKRAGIDGIEYPSGTLSGIKDSPHKNYVVFDDADITIEKRTPR